MPSVATGANMANRDLVYMGVSGDGDTASIGMGQFVHVIRRNLNMVYIVMNNGCYGLTKGQDSATADEGSKSKKGSANPFQPVDLAGLALELGATFVAQSFSGDKEQLIPLVKAAIEHPGFAFINVISPCVTFNNNPGSTKSYDYVREHIEATATTDFVPEKKEITTNCTKMAPAPTYACTTAPISASKNSPPTATLTTAWPPLPPCTIQGTGMKYSPACCISTRNPPICTIPYKHQTGR